MGGGTDDCTDLLLANMGDSGRGGRDTTRLEWRGDEVRLYEQSFELIDGRDNDGLG